jgi:hypothetical protein
MFILVLLFIKSQHAPYSYTALLEVLLTRELYEDGEHA